MIEYNKCSFLQDDVYQIEYDGAAKGNPGPAGAGALVRHLDGSVVRPFALAGIVFPWFYLFAFHIFTINFWTLPSLCYFGATNSATIVVEKGFLVPE